MNYPQPPQDPNHPYGYPGQQGYGAAPPGYGPPPQQFPGQQQGGYGHDPYGGQQYPPGSYYPAGYPAQPGGGAPGQLQRPGTVLGAAIMTYVGSGLLILLGLLFLVGSAIPGFRQGFAEAAGMVSVPAAAIAVAGAFFAIVAVGLITLAVFAQRGSNGARIALTVIGGLFMIVQLSSIVTGGPQAVVGFVWIAVAITLFWVGEANTWYRKAQSQS